MVTTRSNLVTDTSNGLKRKEPSDEEKNPKKVSAKNLKKTKTDQPDGLKNKEPSDDENVSRNKVPKKGAVRNRSQKSTPSKKGAKNEEKNEKMSVTIEVPTGKKIALDVESSDTIETVLAKIRELEGITTGKHRLFHFGTRLENNRTISDYIIQPAAVLSLREVITISVIEKNAEKIELEVEASDTIKSVMERLPNPERFLEHPNHGILYNGTRLEEDKCISDYEVKDGDVLEIVNLTV